MKAAEANLLKFLKKSDQLAIPIYQRTYSWTRSECLQLWDDVIRASATGVQAHFIGSVVYIDTGIYQVTGANAIEIIDGQQRLTTISLLLLALARALDEERNDQPAARKLLKDYLLQDEDVAVGENERYKLLLTRGDRATYTKLVEGLEFDAAAAPRLVDTFELYSEQVRRTSLSPVEVLAGVEKLLLVDIALERDHDNPQLIFESLNSTGLDLSQADLIRNYVLMGLPPKQQEEIYVNSWFPLEQSFPTEQPELFDRFMRDYLTMKTGQIPKIDKVHQTFKTYATTAGPTSADVVADVYRHSKNWVKLAFSRSDDPDLRAALSDLSQLKVEVTFPFLMEVLDDQDEGTLTLADVVSILRLVESYVFRRAVAGIPTNILNKTFASLAREIDKGAYLESVQAALLLKESYARMPADEEFRSSFVVKDVYNFRSRNYLLRRLENHDRKEPVDVDSYTIEHILPQNPDLSPEWQVELGPDWKTIQERWLHTIGNLTLTGYNSELSDRPFADKLTMKGGFKDSPLRLNQYVAQRTSWNEDEIRERASNLVDVALKLWPAPVVSPEVLDRYRKAKGKVGVQYTLADHPTLSGPIRPLFDELRRRIINLDAGVREEIRKQYIAYRLSSNFVEIVPLTAELKLYLDAAIAELEPSVLPLRDVAGVGHWGTGNVEVRLKNESQLNDAMELVRRSLEQQGEEGADEPGWSQLGIEHVVEQAVGVELQESLLGFVDLAVQLGLYPRPSKRALVLAPSSNRNRALLSFSVRDDGQVQRWCSPDAFQAFYGLDAATVERALGAASWLTTTAHEMDALADRLVEVMADAVAAEGEPSRAGKRAAYKDFWSRFLERVHEEHPGWTNTSTAWEGNWFDLKSQIKGAHYSVGFAAKGRLRSELYIDSGHADDNTQLFRGFEAKKSEIEQAFGGSLSWEELSTKRACRIAAYRDGDVLDVERREEFIDWLFDTSARLRHALESDEKDP